MAVLNPFCRREVRIDGDTDLAGPLVFCLMLGMAMLVKGQVQFGYIFGVGTMGCVAIYLLLSLMSEHGAEFAHVTSTLGYCLLPMVPLVLLTAFIPGWWPDHILLWVFVAWSTSSATILFVGSLGMKDARWLIAYPIFLFYTCFGFISVF